MGRLRAGVVGRLAALSLTARLVAIVTGLLVVALVLTGAVTTALLERVLVTQVDQDLAEATDDEWSVARLVNDGRGGGPPVLFEITVQVTAADGSVVYLDGPRGEDEEPLPALDFEEARDLGRRPYDIDAREGYRAVALPVPLPDGGGPVVVTVARSLASVERTLDGLVLSFLLVGAAVVLTCALLGAAAVRRAFRPLRHVEGVATAFGEGDTSRRVDAAPPTTEVGRLGRAVNAMLDRIETSLAAREASENRMRRFVADASHELRTPLAAVRGFAELHRMGAVRDPDDVATAFRRIETEATRMGGLVEDLLLLARLDEQRPLRTEPVDLLLLAADARSDARALAPSREVRLVGARDDAPAGPAVVVGDDARLRQVLANLLANALRHTPDGTPVEIGAGARDGSAVLRVVDHGPGVPEEDAERVFERFYRADTSRARHQGGGSGLGLAIVAAIVAAHGGAVRLVPTPGGGATAEVALPLAASHGYSPPAADEDSADADADIDEAVAVDERV